MQPSDRFEVMKLQEITVSDIRLLDILKSTGVRFGHSWVMAGHLAPLNKLLPIPVQNSFPPKLNETNESTEPGRLDIDTPKAPIRPTAPECDLETKVAENQQTQSISNFQGIDQILIFR